MRSRRGKPSSTFPTTRGVTPCNEAQTLRPSLLELLRQLVNYETNEVKLLQLVLCAQDELGNTLARPSLRNFRSRIVMASTVEPLTVLGQTRR